MLTGEIVVGGNHKNIIYEIKENGCHEVISHKSTGNAGYSKIRINGILFDIHRWYYKRETGMDLKGLDIRHKCDNRKCINIKHLCHGTRKDNVNDMLVRNRQYSELTKQNVIDIINKYNTGKYTYTDLAKLYNVNMNSISSIFKGKTWSHITGIKPNDYLLRNNKSNKQSNEKYIHWDKYNNKWKVDIYLNGIEKYIGRYKTIEEAIIERDKSLDKYKLFIN